MRSDAENTNEIIIINKATASTVQCTATLSRTIPYANAPNSIPPLLIIPTIENTRDIYSLGVSRCINDCTGTLINILAVLNKQRTRDSTDMHPKC